MASSPLDSRASRLIRASRDTFDVVVIGGGAFGAAAARDAALRGLRTLLLEARDYSAGTSSRSSKLLHGGVRYLEQGDFALVAEALAEREIALRTAPHLTRLTPWIFPIVKGSPRPAWQVRLGLGLYDVLARLGRRSGASTSCPGHSKLAASSPQVMRLRQLGMVCGAVLQYYDGQMDDARIVVESVLDAEAAGATVLNHARVESLKRQPLDAGRGDGATGWHLVWRDTCSQVLNESVGRVVINATGAGIAKLHALIEPWPQQWPMPQLTRGTHLLFNVSLDLPPMILPTGESGRYYFILPHFAPGRTATLVGTTDVAVDSSEQGETPSAAEVDELLHYVSRDLPQAGLNRETLFHCFAGTRVLVAKGKGGKTSRLSRSELYLERPQYVTVLGGKYTTSRRIGEQLVDRAERQLGRPITRKRNVPSETAQRVLPGGKDFDIDRLRISTGRALSDALSLGQAERESAAWQSEVLSAVRRFGSQVNLLVDHLPVRQGLPERQGAVSIAAAIELLQRAQIRYAICVEQALEIDDVIDRRLSLWPDPPTRARFAAFTEEEFQRLGLFRRAADEDKAV